MEMINRTAYNELQAAGMVEAQAQVVASHLPDWSQFATKQAAGMVEAQAQVVASHLPDWSQFATKQDLAQGLAQLESRLIRWMVGIFVGSVTVVGGLLTVLMAIVNA